MQPITSVVTTPARPAAAAAGVREPSDVQRADEQQEQKKRPAVDEYIPGEEREPSGCYRPGRDENGEPKIIFDAPEREQQPEGERCICSTDKVDREIEKLKKQKQQLEQKLNTETDETRRRELEASLSQIEQELKQKDNDNYRRQHATYTFT